MSVSLCSACGRPMLAADGCGKPLTNAAVYGDESFLVELGLEPRERCRDCACRLGFAHHRDCLNSWCRFCGDQAEMCECTTDAPQIRPVRLQGEGGHGDGGDHPAAQHPCSGSSPGPWPWVPGEGVEK